MKSKAKSRKKTGSSAKLSVKTKSSRVKPSRRPATSSADFVRTVPLHYPKPSYALDELVRADRDADSDVFDGKPHLAPADAHLTYRGGPLIQNVEVFTVFWGPKWQSLPTAAAIIAKINRFFGDILTSSLIDQLAEYNVGAKKIGHGKFTGTATITDAAPAHSITDAALQTQLRKWIAAKRVPKTTPNTLYFVYLEPGIVSIMGGSKSCQSYCGYHSNTGNVYYAVMPYPSCAGCLGNMQALDALTATSSHEMCEAITDPVPGSGWYDDKNGEIGDICAWNFKTVAGHTVQLEWSNAKKRCV
jgi:hypothetical protein